MMKILTLEDVVNHNADMTTKALRQIKGVSKSVLLLCVAELLMLYLVHGCGKDVKKLEEDIRVMKAEILLDENEIKVLRERLEKENVEKES